MTPRQTCPRPNGFGRNLRSKTRWFTGFCNSHQVSHFATFFIDARAEISVAESRFGYISRDAPRAGTVSGPPGARSFVRVPWRVRRRGLLFRRADSGSAGLRESPAGGLGATLALRPPEGLTGSRVVLFDRHRQ